MILRLPPGGWKINKDPTFMTTDIVHGCVVSSIHYSRRCESATSSWCCVPRMRGRGESKQLLSKTHGSTAAVWRLICRCMSRALLQFAFRKYIACIVYIRALQFWHLYRKCISTQYCLLLLKWIYSCFHKLLIFFWRSLLTLHKLSPHWTWTLGYQGYWVPSLNIMYSSHIK